MYDLFTLQTCFLFLPKHFLTKFHDQYKDLRSAYFDKQLMLANKLECEVESQSSNIVIF